MHIKIWEAPVYFSLSRLDKYSSSASLGKNTAYNYMQIDNNFHKNFN